MIKDKTGILNEDQIITYAGTELTVGNLKKDYHLENGSILEIQIRKIIEQ